MKCPKSGEFSGTVNCSHLAVELDPLKIAYVVPDSPSAERTALWRAAPLLEKIPILPDLRFERLRVGKRLRGSSLGGPINSTLAKYKWQWYKTVPKGLSCLIRKLWWKRYMSSLQAWSYAIKLHGRTQYDMLCAPMKFDHTTPSLKRTHVPFPSQFKLNVCVPLPLVLSPCLALFPTNDGVNTSQHRPC